MREMVMLTKVLENFLHANVKNLKDGSLIFTFPNGKSIHIGNHPEQVQIDFLSWKGIWLVFRRGALGFTEGYLQGFWSTNDLLKLMDFLSKNINSLSGITQGKFTFKLFSRLNHFFNKNTLQGSKKNIAAHYDLGNQFYSLWLDSSMTYSSAIFESLNDKQSLEAAQHLKYQNILDLLNLEPGASILEIGCGWGGFMEYAASKGYKVKGITISPSQFKFAKQRIQSLSGYCAIELIDYRNITGSYDAVVSIEMFEAVGSTFWDIYFKQVQKLLKSDGKAVIQTITIKDELLSQYQKSPDFIQTYIFPGGELASDAAIKELVASNNLEAQETISFPHSYAKTLENWYHNFLQSWDEIEPLGFDEKFKRTWKMYLAYCRGGFLNDRLFVSQYLLSQK